MQPEMSNISKERVEPGGFSENTGVYLTNPIQIKASILRTNKVVKICIAVYIFLVKKSSYLEITLTTEIFLTSLTRITSRRIHVKEIWSDNGTNFQGASLQLKHSWKIIA